MSYVEQIEYGLLSIIGLSIKNNYIYDDDNFDFLIYENGMLKVTHQGIFHKNDYVFDPVYSFKQIQYLFNVFCKKEEIDNGLYIQSLGTNTSQTDLGNSMRGTKYSLHVDTSEGSIDTNYYYNLSLPYIEAIYRISHVFDNDPSIAEKLKMIDFSSEQMIEKLSKKGMK